MCVISKAILRNPVGKKIQKMITWPKNGLFVIKKCWNFKLVIFLIASIFESTFLWPGTFFSHFYLEMDTKKEKKRPRLRKGDFLVTKNDDKKWWQTLKKLLNWFSWALICSLRYFWTNKYKSRTIFLSKDVCTLFDKTFVDAKG